MAMLVDKLPLPSKLPAHVVCHWLNGSARFVLCNNVHEPPVEPLVAEMDSDVPLNLMLVMCGGGWPLPTMICPEPVVNVEPVCCVHDTGKFVG